VARVLDDPPATEPVIPLLDYYARVSWIGTGLDEPFNLRIHRGEHKAAAEGPVLRALARSERAPADIHRHLSRRGPQAQR
jgi:hypothetical protein